MIEMLQWLRTGQHSRKATKPVSSQSWTEAYTVHLGDDVRDALGQNVWRPSSDKEQYRIKQIEVRSKWRYRIVYREPATDEVIVLQETKGESAETIYIPVEQDQSPSRVSFPEPPGNAELILHLFLKGDERDAVIGDLLERYASKHERFGERSANVWFYGEVVRSIWPLLKRLVARASGLIAVGEWIRRHVS